MADIDALSRLIRKADAVAESASVLVSRTLRQIRGELANLAEELNLAGSAKDREKVYADIRRRMAALSRRMDSLMSAQNELAAKTAAKQVSAMTGLEVKYSAKRAEAITELVTPAQGENLAAVFTDRMASSLINSLRLATVAVLREQAVEGGTMKDMTRLLAQRWRETAKMEDPRFTDSSGRTWNTVTYLTMNVRTNTMRVYNDCLLDDIARVTGSDIARISKGGSDPHCVCAAWEGCIISISGKTKGLPTYEQAKNGGCFHPNCVHTLEYIDEDADAEEIALQKAHPVTKGLEDDPDAQDGRKYEIDQDRYRRQGMTEAQARMAVDRDNLTAAIRTGLIRSDARALVDALTDAQVSALCVDGNPPRFEPTKRATRQDPHAADEIWRHGSRGGVVHIARDADAAKLIEVTKIENKDGVVSTITSAVKKAVGKIIPQKQTASKTPEEIKAMKIEDAIKETAHLVDNIEKAEIPEAVSRHESRFEQISRIVTTRRKEWEAARDQRESLDKLLRKSTGDEAAKILDQWEKARQKQIAAAKKYIYAIDLKRKINRTLHKTCLPWTKALLAHGNDKCFINVEKASKGLPIWNEAKSLLEVIVSKDVFPVVPLTVRKLKDDARAYQTLSKICLSSQEEYSIFAHETMHFIEGKNAHVHNRCVEFLQYRTKGESKQKLRILTGIEYGNDEWARPDHFFNPYCGKAYERRDFNGNIRVTSTEILSMGVERLVMNPVRFLREDREYATMCLNLIRGIL